MSRGFLTALGIGLAVVAIGIGAVFYVQRGEHLQPKGSILKSRIEKVDGTHGIVLLDVRVVNDSDVALTVRNLGMSVITAAGETNEGRVLSAGDLEGALASFPALGEQFTPPLRVQDTLPPRSTTDRTVAATFEILFADLEARKGTVLRIEDQSGETVAISGK